MAKKEQGARLARHLSTDPAGETADALSDILIEVSNDSQVFWDNPEIARLLYAEASKLAAEHEDVRMRLGHLREVMDAAEAGKPLAPLMRSWGYTSNPRWREAARPEKGGCAMIGKRNRKPLKQVTDINDYRRSHPRLRTVKYEWVE